MPLEEVAGEPDSVSDSEVMGYRDQIMRFSKDVGERRQYQADPLVSTGWHE